MRAAIDAFHEHLTWNRWRSQSCPRRPPPPQAASPRRCPPCRGCARAAAGLGTCPCIKLQDNSEYRLYTSLAARLTAFDLPLEVIEAPTHPATDLGGLAPGSCTLAHQRSVVRNSHTGANDGAKLDRASVLWMTGMKPA